MTSRTSPLPLGNPHPVLQSSALISYRSHLGLGGQMPEHPSRTHENLSYIHLVILCLHHIQGIEIRLRLRSMLYPRPNTHQRRGAFLRFPDVLARAEPRSWVGTPSNLHGVPFLGTRSRQQGQSLGKNFQHCPKVKLATLLPHLIAQLGVESERLSVKYLPNELGRNPLTLPHHESLMKPCLPSLHPPSHRLYYPRVESERCQFHQ